MSESDPCPHANPVTLSLEIRERLGNVQKLPMKTVRGALTECRYPAGHRGPHRSAAGYETWDRSLTHPEEEFAQELRARITR